MIPQPPQIPDSWKKGRDWSEEIKVAGREMAASRRAIERPYSEKNLEDTEEKEDMKYD